MILQTFRDPESGDEISPDDGERFIRSLHRHLNGDYFFATEAHEDGNCELHVGEEVELRPTDAVTSSVPAKEANPV